MKEDNMRLDVRVIEEGFASSRERAREYILAGKVYVNNKVETKSGKKIRLDDKIEFRGEAIPFVSRGGVKLEKAFEDFGLSVEGKVCLDIGASTGGFTHCMLLHGAEKVYAIDVGRDQLSEHLRKDARVVSLEQTNVKNLTFQDIGEYGDFASIDVSFISLNKVIPYLLPLLKSNGEVVALIKPQFEAGIGKVSKKGVVKDKKIHIHVIKEVIEYLKAIGVKINNLGYSGIKGPNGNIEFLVYFSKDNDEKCNEELDRFTDKYITDLVCEAHHNINLEEI